MESPARVDFGADRYVPFKRTLAFLGYDFTGATFKMQVRDRKDGGAVRADLSTVTLASAEGVRLIYGGSDTVANHITAGRLKAVPNGYTSASTVILSQVGIRINETTMEAMPFGGEIGGEIGDDLELYWDLHVTPSGGDKDLYAAGTFTLRAGVTQ